MPRLALAALAAAVLLPACGGDGKPSASPAPSTAAPTTTAPSPTVSDSPSGGPGCPIQPGLPVGATQLTATVTGKSVSTASHSYSVKLGSKVRIAVTADSKDEVHVHTYDLHADTQPGCPTAIDFTANIPGTVEVELEEAGVHLFDVKAS